MKYAHRSQSSVFQGSVLLTALLAVATTVGCTSGKSSPSPAMSSSSSSSSSRHAVRGANDASNAINEGNRMLSDSITKTASPFHLSYSAQENVNSKFPQEAGSKPQVGPVQLEADLSPDQLSIMNNTNGKKTETKAAKGDELAMAMARLNFLGMMMDSTFSLACGGTAAHAAGSDQVGKFSADKYDIDTTNLSGPELAGFQAATAMLGAKAKLESVKGSAWVDHASGLLVKFNLDSEFSDPAGDKWKEHREMLVTPL